MMLALLRSQYAFSLVLLVLIVVAIPIVGIVTARRSGQVTRILDQRFREDR